MIDYEKYIQEGCTKLILKSPQDLFEIITICNDEKTKLDNSNENIFNDNHSIIQFHQYFEEQNDNLPNSLSLVELAGYRQIAKLNTIGDRMKENIIIKNDLLCV